MIHCAMLAVTVDINEPEVRLNRERVQPIAQMRYRDAERRSSREGAHAGTGPVSTRNSSSSTRGINSINII